MNYTVYREKQGISRRDMIKIISGHYPGYTKVQQSMIENPAKYGVRLIPQAERFLREHCEKTKKQPQRTKPHRLVVYLDDETHERIRGIMERCGYATVQAFLETMLRGMAEEMEERGGGC